MHTNIITFSIGIPAYKSEFLYECINSILNQTYGNFELIIVNDCSPFPVESILAQIKDERIRYYVNENNIGAENVVDNWNKCLEKSAGDYFILMGDDDKMESEYLEEIVKLINKYPALDIYHCRSKIIDENSNTLRLTPSWPEYESLYDNIWHRINGIRIQFISDFIYKTSTLKQKHGFYKIPLAWASDDISCYMAIGEKGIAHLNLPLLNYRKHKNTITSTGNFELKMKSIIIQAKWLEIFLKQPPENEIDLILYKNISNNYIKLIERKKVNLIFESLKSNIVKQLLFWYSVRTNYKISKIDLFKSLILFLKGKLLLQRQNIDIDI